jgi:hypothetical protein
MPRHVIMVATLAFAFFALQSANGQSATSAKHPVPESPLWLTYSGENGPGKGKHIVLIAADQEYRSEYALPMLAKMLAKHHGFDCTVLFSVSKDDEVDPTIKIRWEDKTVTHKIPGLEYLDKADLVILFSRLISLSDSQLAVCGRRSRFHERKRGSGRRSASGAIGIHSISRPRCWPPASTT